MGELHGELLNRLMGLASDLSPENLTCDGELKGWEVRRKLGRLRKQWREAEEELGRKVTEEEVWDAYMHERKEACLPR